MMPDFGCGIHDLVFRPNTSQLRSQVQHHVRESLVLWEPRIDVLDVEVEILVVRVVVGVRQLHEGDAGFQ